MYQYLVIGRGKSYFVKNRSKSNNNYKQDEITHIFAQFGGRVFQQTIGIPMDTNCALLLSDLFLHACEIYFLQGLPLYS
jgi:hypothetical protein